MAKSDIVIFDYGMGNLRSVQKAFEHVGCGTLVTNRKEDVIKAEKLVVPGVGAFGDAMENIRKLDMVDTLKEMIGRDVPFLGICVGLQLLHSVSEEKGKHDGLDVIPGGVKRFPEGLKVPHMGWNQVKLTGESPLTKGIEDNSFFYFVHSYYVDPADTGVVLGQTEYGITFTSMVAKGNLFGIQCHPEKSQATGLALLENFKNL